ncbi:hypothetical protein V8C86DRAFT_1184023 [Haematococcus lacustris]
MPRCKPCELPDPTCRPSRRLARMSGQLGPNCRTQLLDLPEELLGVLLRQLEDADSRSQVFRTNKRLATAILLHTPAIHLTYPLAADLVRDNGDYRRIAPFLAQALLTRQAQLHLTLQPDEQLLAQKKSKAWKLLATTLSAVELCPAVTHLSISFPEETSCIWAHGHSTALAASFPSLTNLSLGFLILWSTHLSRLVSHLALVPRLKYLDISEATIQERMQPAASPFTGSRLQQLSLPWGDWDFTPHLAPLAPHLTQLAVHAPMSDDGEHVSSPISLSSLAAAVGSLTLLQSLELDISNDSWLSPVSELLPVLAGLPSLHTLLLPQSVVTGYQVTKLLACTQITRLQAWRLFYLGFTDCTSGTSCNLRQLELYDMDWDTAAKAPLHSLTHPLRLTELGVRAEQDTEVMAGDVRFTRLAAAEHNLCVCNKAGLEVELMYLHIADMDLLTKLYLSHSRPDAQQAPHRAVASSNLPSSSRPEGPVTTGGAGSSAWHGGQQPGGSAAGGQAIMQRLGPCVKRVSLRIKHIFGQVRLTQAHLQAFAALFPNASLEFR